MTTTITRHWTIAEYYATAILGGERTELIDGEIIKMSPIGRLHASCVNRLNNLLVSRLNGLAVISPQNPVRLNNNSEPQPDLAILRYHSDFYRSAHPIPIDVLFLIEVADSTLTFDREVKVPLYARAGIEEMWIVNLSDQVVERYWQPDPSEGADGKYQNTKIYATGESLVVMSDVAIAVAEIL